MKLTEEEAVSGEKKAAIEEELRGIQPVLDAARSVGGIKKDNLNEIRALKMPPERSATYSRACSRSWATSTTWNSMKRFLGNRRSRTTSSIRLAPITPEIRQSVDDLLRKRGNSFEHAVIHRVSVAASPLAAWVKANLEYWPC